MWLETDCSQISIEQWNKLMKGAKRINYQWLVNKIKKELPDVYSDLRLDLYNPYHEQCFATRTHYILTSSATEYFFRKGNDWLNENKKIYLTDVELRKIIRESIEKIIKNNK